MVLSLCKYSVLDLFSSDISRADSIVVVCSYRHLKQLVPEFNKFLTDNPIVLPGLPRDQGSELLGARLFGRWKSGEQKLCACTSYTRLNFSLGAPIDITPLKDDPVLAKDSERNNNFNFSDVRISIT